ncbi:MAG TPA: deoxyribose-phosphate aldolase [Clostridia bacterium]|nr:deoxyribose-phosphate aldolase [Clostridia bacterium]
MITLSRAELARHLEATLFRPDATRQDVEKLCAEARTHGFRAVCVNSSRVELAATLLEDTLVKVVCLVGFPLGAMESDVKRFETEAAIDLGAQEIETVLNIGRLKDGDDRYVLRELRDIAEAAEERPVKVVLETSLLTPEQINLVCALATDSGVHFVSTGTGVKPATVQDVSSLRAAVGEKFGVKAVGVRDTQAALSLIAAGATRLGVSDGAAIVAGLP